MSDLIWLVNNCATFRSYVEQCRSVVKRCLKQPSRQSVRERIPFAKSPDIDYSFVVYDSTWNVPCGLII